MAEPSPATEELIRGHMQRVDYLVREISARLPSHVDRDALRSAGLLALVQAAAAFDESRGVPFRHYATLRIRGALIDELRSSDLASRSLRQAGRRRDEVIGELAMALGRMPNQEEIADFLGMSVAELDSIDGALHRTTVVSIDAAPSIEAFESLLPDAGMNPEDAIVASEESRLLHVAIGCLPERLRYVVDTYYLQGRPMADIAAVLSVTESRVSQMRAEALVMLRDGLNSQFDEERVPAAERPGSVVDRRRKAYLGEIAQRSRLSTRHAASIETENGSSESGRSISVVS